MTDITGQYPICTVDYGNRAHTRLANQYQESDKIAALVSGLAAEAGLVGDALCECMSLRWIDDAEGVVLDALGRIVGQPRVSADAPFFFGYVANPQSRGYGDARYLMAGEDPVGERVLEDPEYRLFIRAKAFANSSASTPDEIAEHLFLVLGKRAIINNGRAELLIYFVDELTANDIALLNFQWQDARGQTRDFFPYTLGVGKKVFFQSAGDPFGYSANPAAKGYGVGAYSKQL